MMKCSLVYSPLWLANIHFAALFLSRCSLCRVWLSLSLCRFLRDARERESESCELTFTNLLFSSQCSGSDSVPPFSCCPCLLRGEVQASLTLGDSLLNNEGPHQCLLALLAIWHCWWLWSQVKGILERLGGGGGVRGQGDVVFLFTLLCTKSVVVVVDRVVLLCLDVVVVLFLRTRRRS